MISHNNLLSETGFSLFECLIAITLFAIFSATLSQLQQQLFSVLQQQWQQRQAEQAAFQLLQIYPQTAPQLIPAGWQSRISTEPFNQRCHWIQLELHNVAQHSVQQQRLICD